MHLSVQDKKQRRTRTQEKRINAKHKKRIRQAVRLSCAFLLFIVVICDVVFLRQAELDSDDELTTVLNIAVRRYT